MHIGPHLPDAGTTFPCRLGEADPFLQYKLVPCGYLWNLTFGRANRLSSNRSVPTDILLPHLMYGDVEEAIRWLSKTFGFCEHYRYGNPVSGAQMHLGRAWIMLERAQAGFKLPKDLGYGTQSLTILVENVRAHFESTKAAGANILEDLHQTVYGELQYAAQDLEGHHWLFSWHARDLDPQQWGARVAEPVTMESKISPMLSVRRGKQAVEFYQAAFGAEQLYRVEADGGAVVVQLSVGGASFWLADESPEHSNFSPETLGGGSVRMILIVSDPDVVFQRAVARGAKVVWPVDDQPHGWRIGRVLDPYGHHWEIGKPRTGAG